jgi:3-deoxy-D-manno-octulosonic-acid transferase
VAERSDPARIRSRTASDDSSTLDSQRATARLGWRLRAGAWCTLLALLGPLALPPLIARLMRRRKGLVGVTEKRSGNGAPITPGQILVHGVSLGEVTLMRPLVPLLEQALDGRCLLTTTTETGRAQLDQLFPGHQRAFFPFDVPWAVRRFLARARPRLVVLLEFELWPLFLCACYGARIPVVVVNAKISERSFRRFRRAGALIRPLFAALSLVLVQNPRWGARLRALGVRREALIVSGSMKADIVARADPAQAHRDAMRVGLRVDQPVLLLASTSAGLAGPDEEMVALGDRFRAWVDLGWRVVICPRHPERGAGLADRLRAAGAEPRRSSLGERLGESAREVLIVDEIGRLAGLYAWTSSVNGIAVVGGSLGSGRGGQNMLEAAAHGCCTVVGSDTRNFPDAMELLRHAGGVMEARERIPEALLDLAAEPQRRREIGAGAQRAWAAGRGAIVRAVSALRGRFARGS